MSIRKDASVTLKSFLGTLIPGEETDNRENYWQLIGQPGTVIQESDQQVLVLFDINLDNAGLENHNPVKNALWIYRSDLE